MLKLWMEAHDVFSLYQLSIFSVFVRHSIQYNKQYCWSFFVEIKLHSFRWYREGRAKKNGFLWSLITVLSPAPSQTLPREVKLNCCLENCCQTKWRSQSLESSCQCCCFSSDSLHSLAHWHSDFPGSHLKAWDISFPPPSLKPSNTVMTVDQWHTWILQLGHKWRRMYCTRHCVKC